MEELYTKLFVEIECEHADLIRAVASACSGQVEQWTVTSGPCEIDVRPNESRGVGHSSGPADGFLDFPFTVEVVDEALENRTRYLSFVARMMIALHQLGATVVAACEFEDELPGGGTLRATTVRPEE